MKKISLICPVYNEAETIVNHYTQLNACTKDILGYDFEFIYTDNHSEDSTFRILSEIAAKDKRVKVFRFSRNFGYQNSIMTGYQKAVGDAAINFDADLQDPPHLLPEMIKKWEMGYKIIYGIREKRNENPLVSTCRKVFYLIMNSISETHLPRNAGDFMLIDRKILDLLALNHEKNLYLRGLIFSYGFPQIGIPYCREKRFAGSSKFNFLKMFHLALDGVVNQSSKPLLYLFYVGILTTVLVGILGIFTLIAKLFNILPYPIGLTSIVLLVLFSISFNALSAGLIGIYLSRMYTEIKGRPISIIETEIQHES